VKGLSFGFDRKTLREKHAADHGELNVLIDQNRLFEVNLENHAALEITLETAINIARKGSTGGSAHQTGVQDASPAMRRLILEPVQDSTSFSAFKPLKGDNGCSHDLSLSYRR
jgi:hypothetical protein